MITRRNNQRKASRAAAVIGIAAVILMMLAVSLPKVSADDNTMLTKRYDVTVDVSEDNSYDFHEHLDMYYVTPHHGIYRYLPKQGQVISGIQVPGYNFETYTQSGNEVIKIGSGSYVLTGDNPYDIYYNIAMFADGNDEMDMMLINLLPSDWETGISESTCLRKLISARLRCSPEPTVQRATRTTL